MVSNLCLSDQFKLSCPYHVFNRLHPTPALTLGGKKGNQILNIIVLKRTFLSY